MIIDREIGEFEGNLFLLIADKFPINTRQLILDTIDIKVNCKIILRQSSHTKDLALFIKYPKERYTEIKNALNKIYKNIPQEDGYPDVYNPNKIHKFPNIHISVDGTIVVWYLPVD